MEVIVTVLLLSWFLGFMTHAVVPIIQSKKEKDEEPDWFDLGVTR